MEGDATVVQERMDTAWRKRGVVIFWEIVRNSSRMILVFFLMGGGGLVRTIPSSTYFYWRERKRVFFLCPNPSQRIQDCHGWENTGTNEAFDLFESRLRKSQLNLNGES